jgi:hypothetical protein
MYPMKTRKGRRQKKKRVKVNLGFKLFWKLLFPSVLDSGVIGVWQREQADCSGVNASMLQLQRQRSFRIIQFWNVFFVVVWVPNPLRFVSFFLQDSLDF